MNEFSQLYLVLSLGALELEFDNDSVSLSLGMAVCELLERIVWVFDFEVLVNKQVELWSVFFALLFYLHGQVLPAAALRHLD